MSYYTNDKRGVNDEEDEKEKKDEKKKEAREGERLAQEDEDGRMNWKTEKRTERASVD